MEQNIKNNPKIMNAWAFYDWANSVYSLVITSTIFPIYFATITTLNLGEINPATGNIAQAGDRHLINILGRAYEPDAVYSYSLTISFLIVVILSPILSSLADIIGNKKSFLQFFCYLGATSCMGLAMFTNMHNLSLGILFSITASVGFWGSLVFYNSFLPDIATKEKQDALSAKGYVYGYIGSVILVLVCLVLILVVAKTPEQTKLMTRISFLFTGAWWFGFSQYTFKHLPQFGEVKEQLPKDLVLLNLKNIFSNHKKNGGFLEVLKDNIIFYIEIGKESFKELHKIKNNLFANLNLKRFLLSFFFYSIGMQTIFLMATLYGKSELQLETAKLITTLIIIQIVAIFGAILFSRLSRVIGNKNVISIALVLWIFNCLSAYFLDKNNPNKDLHFYIVAGVVGLVMGGIQSMSRSTYSRLLPKNSMDNTTYFSFYDVLEKIAIIIGTFFMGLFTDNYISIRNFFIDQLNVHLPNASGMRFSFIFMSLFFAIGLFFIRFVSLKSNEAQKVD